MYWTTKTGEELKISNMKTSHIENCIKLLERNAKNGVHTMINCGYAPDNDYIEYEENIIYGEEYLDITSYKELNEELNNRKLITNNNMDNLMEQVVEKQKRLDQLHNELMMKLKLEDRQLVKDVVKLEIELSKFDK